MLNAIAILALIAFGVRVAIVRARRRRIRRIAIGAVFGSQFRAAARPQAVRRAGPISRARESEAMRQAAMRSPLAGGEVAP